MSLETQMIGVGDRVRITATMEECIVAEVGFEYCILQGMYTAYHRAELELISVAELQVGMTVEITPESVHDPAYLPQQEPPLVVGMASKVEPKADWEPTRLKVGDRVMITHDAYLAGDFPDSLIIFLGDTGSISGVREGCRHGEQVKVGDWWYRVNYVVKVGGEPSTHAMYLLLAGRWGTEGVCVLQAYPSIPKAVDNVEGRRKEWGLTPGQSNFNKLASVLCISRDQLESQCNYDTTKLSNLSIWVRGSTYDAMYPSQLKKNSLTSRKVIIGWVKLVRIDPNNPYDVSNAYSEFY